MREKHNEIYVFAVNQRLTDAPYTPGFGKTYLLKKGWFVYARIQN